jgi:hypothetical protein
MKGLISVNSFKALESVEGATSFFRPSSQKDKSTLQYIQFITTIFRLIQILKIFEILFQQVLPSKSPSSKVSKLL